MPTSTITSRGQTVVPKPVRDYLGLHPGDRLDYIIDSEHSVTLKPASLDVKELKGALHKPGRKAVSLDDMKRVIAMRGAGK